jgi:hypothetical protein
MSNDSQRPVAELLAELEAAVGAADRDRATQLERTILQRLATEAADRDAVERRVRELMATLDQRAAPHDRDRLKRFAPDLERGGPASAGDGVVYPVWFGTNRRPTPEGNRFTGERHDRVTRGRVEVFVPEAHRFGETGTAFWKRLLRFDLRDDHLRVQRVQRQERDDFFAEIQRTIEAARESGEQPHALFFLHGFNVTFEDAAIRAAQLGRDLEVPGATAFFSWPSRGTVTAYPADEATIEASERAITDFLVEDTVIRELKSVEKIPPIHQAQLPSYPKLSGKPVGLLINFNVVHLRDAPGSALRFSRWSLRLAHSSFSIASSLRLAATLSPPFLARRAQFGWAWRSRNSRRQGKLQRLVGTLREGEILRARGR